VREKYAVRERDDALAVALIMPLLETHESYLGAALAAVDAHPGGATAFLAGICGVGPAELRGLRALYTV
jgi:hypothetical protein